MDLSTINPALVAIPAVGSAGVLGYSAWSRIDGKRKAEQAAKEAAAAARYAEKQRQQRIANARIPEGAGTIITPGRSREVRGELVGNYLCLACGTFGRNQLLRFLILLDHSGLANLISAIGLLENDAQLRRQFEERLPECYKDRIVYGYSEAYGGGMGGQAVDDVLEEVEDWGVPVDECAAEVIDRCLRRSVNKVPGVTLLFLGLGGQAPTALPLLQPIHDRFEKRSLILGFVALSEFTDLRDRFAAVKPRYEDQGGVFGWILTDDLNANPTTSDYGMLAQIVGFADGALYADQPSQPNNAYTRMLPQERGGILIYQTFASSVVAHPFQADPSVPTIHYVYKEPLAAEMNRCLRRVAQDKGLWSADLPVGEAGRVVTDLVITSLYHEDLKQMEDRIYRGAVLHQKLAPKNGKGKANGTLGNLFGQPNYKRIFASLATTIDPQKPDCPVVVVRTAAVTNGQNIVPEIVKPPSQRNRAQLHAPAAQNGAKGGTSAKQTAEGAKTR